MGDQEPLLQRNPPIAGEARFMLRAIALAQRASGYTSPNPMVGCVLVQGSEKTGYRIVGEGFHAGAGAAHAEAVALRAAGPDAKGATAYVTLEPCTHYGRTPPCAEAIIRAGIAKVVYAVADPNPEAAGGAARLKSAGIEVTQGLCAEEAEDLIRYWLWSLLKKRPYVTAKFAASLDGRIATRNGESKWITNKEARARAHDLRQASDALIVGVDTLLKDDPALTARPVSCARRRPAHPLRVILDSTGRTPLDAQILRASLPGSTCIATTQTMPQLKRRHYESKGAKVWVLHADDAGYPSLAALMARLYEAGCLSVMVEGGARVLGSFLKSGLIDEVWAFIAPLLIGGDGFSAIAGGGTETISDAFHLHNPQSEHFGDNFLIRGRMKIKAGDKAPIKAHSGVGTEARIETSVVVPHRIEEAGSCLQGS